jgi:ubiquinol-cytochrome c reductase cytochrome c1 subunit
MSPKEVFVDACGRCHDMKYDKFFRATDAKTLEKYLGKNPPDLSIMIRFKGEEYLRDFIDDPQKLLHGTSMPRVGLTEKSTEEVVSYIEKVGDRKKDERKSTTINIMIFLAILSVFAYLWKNKLWSEVH